MSRNVECPLCRSEAVWLLQTISVSRLIEAWHVEFNINIESELAGLEQFGLYSCRGCDLHFFNPPRSGSDRLYSQLQHFSWYYMARKWEHDAALDDISTGDRVLEVGCGPGHFVSRLWREKRAEAIGIEMNSAAVALGHREGCPVYLASLEDMKSARNGAFDVICSFQVLEHVPDPQEFISSCVALLRLGGLLQISVPNRDSFLRFDRNGLLNQPPHHITRWSKSVFDRLSQCCPLRLVRVSYEPLADYHLEWYVNIQLSRLPNVPVLTRVLCRVITRACVPVLRYTGAYHHLRGHTIYVCYEKIR